jgi:hypothetical protein
MITYRLRNTTASWLLMIAICGITFGCIDLARRSIAFGHAAIYHEQQAKLYLPEHGEASVPMLDAARRKHLIMAARYRYAMTHPWSAVDNEITAQ